MKAGNDFAAALMDALDDAGIRWRAYSGRGMHGEYCVGVDCGYAGTLPSESEVHQAVHAVKRSTETTRDAMGKGTILYWTGAKLTPE